MQLFQRPIEAPVGGQVPALSPLPQRAAELLCGAPMDSGQPCADGAAGLQLAQLTRQQIKAGRLGRERETAGETVAAQRISYRSSSRG